MKELGNIDVIINYHNDPLVSRHWILGLHAQPYTILLIWKNLELLKFFSSRPIDSRRLEGIGGFKMTKERTHRQSCGEWIEGFDQSKIDY